MPYKVERLDEGRGILRIWIGNVTVGEVAAANEDYFAREDWTKLEYVITDFAGITDFQATTAEIRQLASLAARIATFKPCHTIAIVAPSDFVFGLARMWEIFAEQTGWNTRVFRSRPEAEAWVHV